VLPDGGKMTDIHYLSAIALAGEIGAGGLSSLEVVSHLIDRIEARDDAINAVVVRDFDRALASAAEADARKARGESLPLLGVPMLAKESFDLAGKPTTWGFAWGRDAIAESDAVAIGRLKAAGAVVLGKSNAMEGLWDWQTYNPVYGTTNNPWDLARSQGLLVVP
jgi:amidase